MRRLRSHLNPAFTLLELLVVIAIIAVLVGILLPVLARAREQGRLLACLSNIRGQGMTLYGYTADYDGAMPPRVTRDYFHGEGSLINEILAHHEHQDFDAPLNTAWRRPTGIWRCPEVRDDNERSTHSGIIHHAPNRWLFNSVATFDGEEYVVSTDSPAEWAERYGTESWRHIDQVAAPSEIVALIDNVYYFFEVHGHWEARESIGSGQDIILDPDDVPPDQRQASHASLQKRPAVFVDGHTEALSSIKAYWQDVLLNVHPMGNSAVGVSYYQRDIQRLMWFVGPGETETPPQH